MRNFSSIARDCAFIRYITATSLARNRLDSSSSARRVRTDRARPPDQPVDLARDPLGLLLLVEGLEALDRHAALVLGPQLLVGPALVARHDGVGRVEDQLRRAVVLLELDDRRLGVVALEVEDVLDVRAPPAVDRLVVVPHHAQVPVGRRQRPDPQVLRPVRVLVLVDVQVAPARWYVASASGDCSNSSTARSSRSSKSSALAARSRSR